MAIPVRLHRSELCVPGTNMRMLEKAPGLGADVVMLDLEDAVAPDDKPEARRNVIAALQDLDWSGCCVTVRINGLDTQYCYRDIVDVVEQGGEWLDTVLVPKAASAGVAIPPAEKFGTGSLPVFATSRTSSTGACKSLAWA